MPASIPQQTNAATAPRLVPSPADAERIARARVAAQGQSVAAAAKIAIVDCGLSYAASAALMGEMYPGTPEENRLSHIRLARDAYGGAPAAALRPARPASAGPPVWPRDIPSVLPPEGQDIAQISERFDGRPLVDVERELKRLERLGEVYHGKGRENVRPWFAGKKPEPTKTESDSNAAESRRSPRRVATDEDLQAHGRECLIAAGAHTTKQLDDMGAGIANALCRDYALRHTEIRTLNGKTFIAIPIPDSTGRRYYMVKREALQDAIFVDSGIDNFVALYKKSGKKAELTDINRQISTLARGGALYDGTTTASHLNRDSLYHQRVWDEQPIVPRYHLHSELFLRSWFDGYFTVCDWIYFTRRQFLGVPCLLLIIQSATRFGKSLIVEGVGKFYRQAGPIPGENIFSQFNINQIESPIINFAETFPKDFKGELISPARLKEFVTCSSRDVESKGVDRATLIGCTRSVLTVNPPDFYPLGTVTDQGSRDALAARFLMVTAPTLKEGGEDVEAAARRVRETAEANARATREPTLQETEDAVLLGPARYLSALGGRPFTTPNWIEGDGLFVSHLKWVQQTWTVAPERMGDSLCLKSNVEIVGQFASAMFRKKSAQ